MNDGWISFHREMLEDRIWKNPLKLRLFILVVSNARFNYEPIMIEEIKIERGQYLRSFRKLSEDLSYYYNNAIKQPSTSQIKTAIDSLVRDGYFTKTITRLGTLFTVTNYDKFQPNKNKIKEYPNNNNGSNGKLRTGLRTDLEQTWNNTNKDNKVNKYEWIT